MTATQILHEQKRIDDSSHPIRGTKLDLVGTSRMILNALKNVLALFRAIVTEAPPPRIAIRTAFALKSIREYLATSLAASQWALGRQGHAYVFRRCIEISGVFPLDLNTHMSKSAGYDTMPNSNAALSRLEGGKRMHSGARPVSPFVSIITVVFNAARELVPLMNSVFAHQNDQVEFLVIDGGSKDGTLELLRASDARIDYWMSEPDGGIYDAMNKGISAAHGEYLLHLNAGDKLLTVPLEVLRACSQKKVDVATFSVLVDSKRIFRPKTGFLLTIENTWHHQGTFYRRAIHPGYDANYRVFGDMCLNQKMFKEGRSVQLFDTVIAEHRDDGISNSRDSVGEVYKAIRSNFGWQRVLLAFLWFKYKGLRHRFGMLLHREKLNHR